MYCLGLTTRLQEDGLSAPPSSALPTVKQEAFEHGNLLPRILNLTPSSREMSVFISR